MAASRRHSQRIFFRQHLRAKFRLTARAHRAEKIFLTKFANLNFRLASLCRLGVYYARDSVTLSECSHGLIDSKTRFMQVFHRAVFAPGPPYLFLNSFNFSYASLVVVLEYAGSGG